MDELQRILKQIEDLKTYYSLSYNGDDEFEQGWGKALESMESWVKNRMNAIIRNSDKRPY